MMTGLFSSGTATRCAAVGLGICIAAGAGTFPLILTATLMSQNVTMCGAAVGGGLGTLSAQAPGAFPNPRTCSLMGICGMAGGPPVPFTCIFTGMDGLPVELLDFTIDESADSQSEEKHEKDDSTTQ